MLKQYNFRNYRYRLVLYLILLTIIGIVVIGSAEKSVQSKQILGFLLGLIVMIIVSLIDYSYVLKFCWVYYFITNLLLLLVLVTGESSNGSQRWINIAGIRFQPSELAKILFILMFSYYFMKHSDTVNSIKTIAVGFLIAIPPLLLILMQPDTSTTIMTLLIFIVLLFIAGLSYKIVLGVLGIVVPIGLVALTLIVKNADSLIAGGHYQVKRIMAWLYPTNKLYSEYATQQRNSVMAIGSGQLWGKGLYNTGSNSMKSGNYIIEPQTDFIFSVVGEELGFIGSFAIIILLFLISIECILIARKAKDLSGRLICCGMATIIIFQSFINLCVATQLMPNTGIPLPFVSYGLTSLMSLYIGMGFVLNVGLQPKKY